MSESLVPFGRVGATLGLGPYAGAKLRAVIGWTPKDTHVFYYDHDGVEHTMDTVSAIEVDVLRRIVTIKERFVCSKEEYDELVRSGQSVTMLGEAVRLNEKNEVVITAVVERTTSGSLDYCEFRGAGMHIQYDGNPAKPVSFAIFNYEPTTNLSKLVVSASALRSGTGWLSVEMALYPTIE